MRRALAALCILLGLAAGAHAHAVLEAADPPDGAALAAAPARIALRFSEPVLVVRAVLRGPDGPAAQLAERRAEDGRVALDPPPQMRAGTWLLSWRVVSADGHPVAGTVVFAIGAAPPPPAAAEMPGHDPWFWPMAAAGLVRDLCLVFAAGGALFLAWVGGVGGLRAAIALAALLSAAAGFVSVWLLGAAALGEAALTADAWRIGANTTRGPAAIAGAAGLALIALAVFARGPVLRLGATAGAALAAGGAALTGHAAAEAWYAQPAFAAHLLAVALWLGAFVPLLCAARAPPESAGALAARFSPFGIAAACVVAVSGVALAAARLDGIAQLTDSDYGLLVLAKAGGFVALLAVAALNRLRLTPALRAGDGRASMRFRVALRLDLALGVAVLALAASLAHTPPPEADEHRYHAEPEAAVAPETIPRAARQVSLGAVPGRPGANVVLVQFFGPDGVPFAPLEVTLSFALPAAGIEPIRRRAVPAGPGRFQVSGGELAVAGDWDVAVEALITEFERQDFQLVLMIR